MHGGGCGQLSRRPSLAEFMDGALHTGLTASLCRSRRETGGSLPQPPPALSMAQWHASATISPHGTGDSEGRAAEAGMAFQKNFSDYLSQIYVNFLRCSGAPHPSILQ